MKPIYSMIINILLFAGVLYLLFCFLLYWNQERLIFHPTKIASDYHFPYFNNAEELFFPIENGKIHALHFKTQNPKGIVLYFHGNSEGLESWGYVAEDFTNLGYDVLMPDYRTYGKSTGKLCEEGLNEDALLMYNYLKNSWPDSKIILYGRSLGTGIGTELATKVKAKILILETPYTSIPAMANKKIPFVPVKWLVNYQFHNLSKIKKLKCPIHIFGATDDMLTPFQHAVKLAGKTDDPTGNLTAIKGASHGNIGEFPVYHAKLKALLYKL